MSLLAMPAGVGLMVLSWPIMNLIYFAVPDEVNVGAPLLSILGVAVVFNCVVLLTNAILQAFGRVNIPVLTMAVGGVIKIVTNFILVGTPSINIYGAPVGTSLCYGTIAILNILFILREVPQARGILRAFVKPLIASALMGGTAWGFYVITSRYIGARLGVLISIAAACVVYLVLIIVLKAVTKEDLTLIPRGDKIAKMLRIQ
jgi:stage V sporulation protein B